MFSQTLSDFDTVLRHALYRDGRRDRWSVPLQCSACAALIPLHDREMSLPSSEQGQGPGIGYVSGAAMQEEQDRVVAILAANGNPLFDPADAYETRLIHALRRLDGELLSVASAQKRNQL